jgi:signal transduction histidine kinase
MVMKANAEDRSLTDEERQDVMESLKTIDQRSKSLKEFVNNFKSVNRIPEPNLEKIDIASLVDELVPLYAKELENERIQLKINIPSQNIYADKNLTQQVFINLIKNAAEAMSNLKEKKLIELSLSRDGHRLVHLHVRDTGSGISQDEIDQIFIPFFSTKTGGSGIGLSISKQIMQKQKGDISVQSEPGKGSIFTLSFTC